MSELTPWASLGGGVLIGLAALGLLLFNGRIAGISGIVNSLVFGPRRGNGWRLAFVGGLLAGGAALTLLHAPAVMPVLDASPRVLVLAGLLVGFGTRLGSGCTSGHGVCGIGRLSLRSLAATAVFVVSGMLVATAVGLGVSA